MVEIRNLNKSFSVGKGKRKVTLTPLEDVSFEIADAQKAGLTGKSGQGKTTLANVLCGSCAPCGGQVLFNGQPLWNDKGRYDKELGKKVQLVPQQPLLALDPAQRAGDAVKEALIVSKNARHGKDAKEKALALFERVGLENTLWTRLPAHLSGGQAQRLVIARALALKPSLLVCDESTSMLDAVTQKGILELIDSLVKDLGLSVLFISHDTQITREFCDKVYLLDCGRVQNANDAGADTKTQL